MTEVRSFTDNIKLGAAAAEYLCTTAIEIIALKGRCTIALSGGTTPDYMFEALLNQQQLSMPWQDIHLFWNDERCIAPDHPDSNYGRAQDKLLRHISMPADHIHPIPAWEKQGKEMYAEILQEEFQSTLPQFDICLLGMGADGHTASLFPGDPAGIEEKRSVVNIEAPQHIKPHLPRISLSMPALNQSSHVLFIISGTDKRQAFEACISGDSSLPASMVQPAGTLLWMGTKDCIMEKYTKN